MHVRAVIFDFGGVILAPMEASYVEVWARRLSVSPVALQQALWGEHWQALEQGRIDDATYNRRVGADLNLPDMAAVQRFLRSFYANERLLPEMLALVRCLRRTPQVRVALLTNAFRGQDKVMQRKWGINPHDLFDVYVNSAEVGLAKPDPAIYTLTLERLGVAPDQALFIDDQAANVQAAAELGIHTIHFEGIENLADVVAQVTRWVGL